MILNMDVISNQVDKIIESIRNENLLIIVACSSKKVWDDEDFEPLICSAKSAYTGMLFNKFKNFYTICYDYLKPFDQKWMILSAKFGLISPERKIYNYNVTFSKPYSEKNDYVKIDKVKEMFDNSYNENIKNILIWGGGKYVTYIEDICKDEKYKDINLITPFKDYRIGECLKIANKLNDVLVDKVKDGENI